MFRGRLQCTKLVVLVEAGFLSMLALSWPAARGFSQRAPSTSPWVPTQGGGPNARYAGRQACMECHVAEATQSDTPMAQASELAANCEILIKHPVLIYRLGSYAYRIARFGNGSIYSVTDGKKTISVPILWAFGKGEAGQTYVFEHDGTYYQSRVSFFSDSQGLDLTLGMPRDLPQSVEEALGERQAARDARDCIACHTTNAVTGAQLHVQTLFPGVSCEACHGPGQDHVAAIKDGNRQRATIFNPGKLAPGELDEFCGSCHHTWWQVQTMLVRNVFDVRFQPYRLENSRCWDSDDTRIGCLACHSPHQPRRRDVAFYDTKCLSCHLSAGAKRSPKYPGKACPVGRRDCINCHMPKYEVPGGHFKFTDHYIRIVRPGAAYPG